MRLRHWTVSCLLAASITSASLAQAAPKPPPIADPQELAVRMSEIRDRYAGKGENLAIGELRLSAASVPAFSRLEVGFDLSGSYRNPFDPDQVRVDALITRPDGTTATVPAFFCAPYEPAEGLTLMTVNKNYRPAGTPEWRVRYAPDQVGEYRIVIQASDASGQLARSSEQSFSVTPSDNKGFVRVSRTNPMYFENSADSSLFFAVGSNVAWTRTEEASKGIKGPVSYEHYFGRAKGKMNATRVWLCHWAWLEWTPQNNNHAWLDYGGANHYNQMISSALDRVFQLAEEQGLRIMLVTEDNDELRNNNVYMGTWGGHPYNVRNGGPCENPQDVFVNEEARRLYRNRLHYIIARWGYSPSLWAINSMNDYQSPTEKTLPWLKEVSSYVHELFEGWRPIIYGSNLRYEAEKFTDYAQALALPNPNKPNVVQECFYTPVVNLFRQELHEQLWTGFARGLGGIMVWDHVLVDRTDSWDEFLPVMRFAQSLPLNSQPWRKLEANVVTAKADSEGPYMRATIMTPYGDLPRWGVRATRDRFEVDLSESTAWLEGFAPSTYSKKHMEWHSQPEFVFNMPADGQFHIECREIGNNDSTMEVFVRSSDNEPWKLVKAQKFEDGRRLLREEEQWVSVPVTKGPQQVKFGVQGDWVRVNRIVITYNFPEPDGIVQPIGWTNGTHAFLYVLNQSYSRMLSDTFGNKAVNITDIEVEVPGLADGTYSIEIVSTQDGDVVNRQVASTSDGKLKLSIPQLSRDLAIRMLPQTESAQAR